MRCNRFASRKERLQKLRPLIGHGHEAVLRSHRDVLAIWEHYVKTSRIAFRALAGSPLSAGRGRSMANGIRPGAPG
jgi:hypothetical protein